MANIKPKAVKIKQPSKSTIYKHQLELQKFQYAKMRSLGVKTSSQLKKSSYKDINLERTYRDTYKPSTKMTLDEQRVEKMNRWQFYAKQQYFPLGISRIARKLNKDKNFKRNASYGYGVMFYAYVESEPPALWADRLKADNFLQMVDQSGPVVRRAN